jgi:hypothetical protein
MCDSAAGKRYTSLVYGTCKNHKICFIYGAQDFCTGQIKYLKLCSTFSQALSMNTGLYQIHDNVIYLFIIFIGFH